MAKDPSVDMLHGYKPGTRERILGALERLRTRTRYSLRSLSVLPLPLLFPASSAAQEGSDIDMISVAWSSPAVPTLPGGRRLQLARLSHRSIGRQVWPGAPALCAYLREHARELLPPRHGGGRVLELGCGTGVCGLYAAAMGARVTLSDSSSLSGEEGLFDTIRRNMDTNRALIDAAHGAVECIELRWCALRMLL